MHVPGWISRMILRDIAVGTTIGLGVAGVWKYWHTQVDMPRREDYYKQLAKKRLAEQ
eukprot:TRINITY_DN17355_c0_g1_i1.p1 TRINITY_DN17355_c0_g1~~TRINITY_DN17355_c0_g1_i1.p1  ORF type:complete len:57 (-),score=18.41 TRINITY_DN17355_c0_g1_i1:12-182(-)